MLKIQKDIPYKETFKTFASFPKFSIKEKITPKFFANPKEGSLHIAQVIRDSIVEKQKLGQKFVMAIGTGRSPVTVYEELIRMHQKQKLSFKNVIIFQLDEYYPIFKTDPQSYYYQLRQNFIDHVDILQENLHMLDGDLPKQQIVKFCENFEKKIKEVGGIDLIVIGIGRSGHIGFNEPPAPSNSSTRLVYLNRLTRKDATGAFGSYEHVPKCAITMGIKTIKSIKRIIVMAWSQVKAPIVLKSIQGQSNVSNNPISFLHDHPNIEFYLDRAAGEKLARFATPWIMKGDQQDPYVPRTKYWLIKSVLWLSETVKKPILRLTRDDYEDNGLAPIMMDVADGNVEDLNLYVYKHMKQIITGWPLGDRPNEYIRSENPHRIHKKSVVSENVLIFSPHPDDDVISMGGTFCKLVKQGHNVSVAYMTSGSNAVHDHDCKKYLHFLQDFTKQVKKQYQEQQNPDADILKCFEEYENEITKTWQSLNNKNKFNRQDCQPIIDTKRIIRVSEAKIAVNSLGLPSKNTYAISLPFYGRNLKKVDISNADYQIIKDLLRLTQPSVIYAAGDLTDPHGTHRKCLEILLHVIDEQHEKQRKDHTYKPLVPPQTRIFLYRGAWEEWDLAVASYLVVLSPLEAIEKQQAILHHQSQRDPPMFAGDDDRQFWLRAKQRNRQTAQKLNTIGFADYEAVECFVDLRTLRSYDDI